jgi:hypothetical protein
LVGQLCSPVFVFVIVTVILEAAGDVVVEVYGGLDDLRDNLATACVLGLDHVGLDCLPLIKAALRNQRVASASFSFDLLDEERHELVHSVLVVDVRENIKDTADTLLDRR